MLIDCSGDDIPTREKDKGLFVPQFPSAQRTSKRPFAATAETDDDEADTGEGYLTNAIQSESDEVGSGVTQYVLIV